MAIEGQIQTSDGQIAAAPQYISSGSGQIVKNLDNLMKNASKDSSGSLITMTDSHSADSSWVKLVTNDSSSTTLDSTLIHKKDRGTVKNYNGLVSWLPQALQNASGVDSLISNDEKKAYLDTVFHHLSGTNWQPPQKYTSASETLWGGLVADTSQNAIAWIPTSSWGTFQKDLIQEKDRGLFTDGQSLVNFGLGAATAGSEKEYRTAIQRAAFIFSAYAEANKDALNVEGVLLPKVITKQQAENGEEGWLFSRNMTQTGNRYAVDEITYANYKGKTNGELFHIGLEEGPKYKNQGKAKAMRNHFEIKPGLNVPVPVEWISLLSDQNDVMEMMKQKYGDASVNVGPQITSLDTIGIDITQNTYVTSISIRDPEGHPIKDFNILPETQERLKEYGVNIEVDSKFMPGDKKSERDIKVTFKNLEQSALQDGDILNLEFAFEDSLGARNVARIGYKAIEGIGDKNTKRKITLLTDRGFYNPGIGFMGFQKDFDHSGPTHTQDRGFQAYSAMKVGYGPDIFANIIGRYTKSWSSTSTNGKNQSNSNRNQKALDLTLGLKVGQIAAEIGGRIDALNQDARFADGSMGTISLEDVDGGLLGRFNWKPSDNLGLGVEVYKGDGMRTNEGMGRTRRTEYTKNNIKVWFDGELYNINVKPFLSKTSVEDRNGNRLDPGMLEIGLDMQYVIADKVRLELGYSHMKLDNPVNPGVNAPDGGPHYRAGVGIPVEGIPLLKKLVGGNK
ncbi:MAG: hypothetical protein ABIC95_03060 [archaeon]